MNIGKREPYGYLVSYYARGSVGCMELFRGSPWGRGTMLRVIKDVAAGIGEDEEAVVITSVLPFDARLTDVS